MKTVVTGGAGFIGSHLVDRLLQAGHEVVVIDNMSNGRAEFMVAHKNDPRFRFVKADVRSTKRLIQLLDPTIDTVFHLAANADIARGAMDPRLDFEHTIITTFSLLQAMRQHHIKKLVFTSGSGVYGDQGRTYTAENSGPLKPISLYGAAKLGAEGLISAFAHLYGLQAAIVRPANITGPRTTHGVVLDFVRQLQKNLRLVRILGDGQQSKSYLHVADVIDALLLVEAKAKEPVSIYNISSNSFLTVDKIAEIIIKTMKLKAVRLTHTGGRRGWIGDVPIVRLRSQALRRLGWQPRYTSTQAIKATVASLL